ncbi:MAG: helix-turn-helix domain-containing protein [Lentimicrobium sp.]|jgi:excisionase family DNA binding protein|nr:helix-turn-helix domain-containing protein [Lentimicrobium sp.]
MATEKAIEAALRNRQMVNRLIESTDKLQPPNLITTDQLANLMQVSGRTIRNWRTAGIIPFVKIRHLVFFEMKDVLKLISSNKRQ